MTWLNNMKMIKGQSILLILISELRHICTRNNVIQKKKGAVRPNDYSRFVNIM